MARHALMPPHFGCCQQAEGCPLLVVQAGHSWSRWPAGIAPGGGPAALRAIAQQTGARKVIQRRQIRFDLTLVSQRSPSHAAGIFSSSPAASAAGPSCFDIRWSPFPQICCCTDKPCCAACQQFFVLSQRDQDAAPARSCGRCQVRGTRQQAWICNSSGVSPA